MLKLRNLTLLRRLYVHILALVTRLAYGAEALQRGVGGGGRGGRGPADAASRRIRRINSELEFGPGEWEGGFLDGAFDTGKGFADAGGGCGGKGGFGGSAVAATTAYGGGGSGRAGKEAPFRFEDACVCITDGLDAIVGDSLTRCFTSEPSEPWNFLTRNLPPGRWALSPYMTLLWLLGLWVRYCVLLPIRVFTLVAGFTSFCIAYPLVGVLLPPGDGGAECLQIIARKFLLRYLASVFVASWMGYVRFHGKRPERQDNQIYVANHTSLIDVFVLVRDYNFSCIGQRHTGLAGALQDLIGTAQQHVWFDREEGRDRKAVQRLLKEHVADGSKEPMLVFPEGTCTTTDYCIMFKKGSFELDAKVYPIAMRYRKEFGDAFWNSTTASFPRHLVDLMTSWAIVCDVYYMEPMTIGVSETPAQFAYRVKKRICDRAQLIDVNWDGFLKRHRISPKFLAQRQKAIAAAITRRLNGEVPRPWSTSNLSALAAGKGHRPLPRSQLLDASGGGGGGDDGGVCRTAQPKDEIACSSSLVLARTRSRSTPASLRDSAKRRNELMFPPEGTAAAITAAATNAVRWGFAFFMLALAGGITAVLMPVNWIQGVLAKVIAR